MGVKQPLDQAMTEERDLECSYRGEADWVSVVAIWVGLILPFVFAFWVGLGWLLLKLAE